jgi:hypothetical protein
MTEVALIDVSSRLWHYYHMDLDGLFARYITTARTFSLDLTHQMMVEAIVRYELGDEIVDKYMTLVEKWDEFERLADKEIHK